MNTPKHTPGPWQVSNADKERVLDSRSLLVAVSMQMPGGFRDEQEANARLISIAPELREVLEEMIDCHKVNPALWDKARAILAKIHQ